MRCFILLVAEVPKWISRMVEDSEIDFAIFKHFQPKTTAELVAHFDENLEGAKKLYKRLQTKISPRLSL
jgi:hypothetical protein